ncbi:MAG: hypothetical protein WAU89_13470 [Candidatus Acidiferrales bacterium]
MLRREAQKVFDQQGQLLIQLVKDIHGDTGVDETGHQVRPPQDGLITLLAKLDMTLAFITHKLNITPGEFQVFMESKMAEFQALQAAAKTAQSEEPKN